MQVYIPVYRKLLHKALKATWQHRALWFFGFLACLAQSGAITNDVLRLAPKLAPGTLSWSTLEASWDAFSYGQSYVAALITGTPSQILVTLLLSLGGFLLIVLLVLVSQHLVLTQVHRTSRNKKHRSHSSLLADIRGVHLVRLFTVNVISRLALLIVLLLGALALRAVLQYVPTAASLYASLGIYLIILPFAFLVNAVGMIMLIHVVRANDRVHLALQKATTLLTRNWLSAVEFSGLLFLINFVLTLFLASGLYLAAILVLALLNAVGWSMLLTLSTIALAALVILILVVTVGGMITTFNYAAWTEFLERFERLPAHPRSEHAVRHVLGKFSR